MNQYLSPSRMQRYFGIPVAGAAVAAVAVFLMFSIPTLPNQFVALDDYSYIIYHPLVSQPGVGSAAKAFVSFTEGNWHPVTVLSLMLDHWIWGLDPTAFHLTNIAIHSMTVFCLCMAFAQLLEIKGVTTAREERKETVLPICLTGVAAALFFGLHPLRVESVVWASQRKDVLCLLFSTLALFCHLRHGIAYNTATGRGWTYYGGLLFTTLALMSKPTAVSLPFLLLVLDWYPLGRISTRRELVRCVVEKLPHLMLAAATLLVTLLAQQVAMGKLHDVALPSRLLVACKAVLFYLYRTVWPAGLAPFYSHPGNVVDFAAAGYLVHAAATGALVVAALLLRRRAPLWTALILFYLVALFPTLGLVQVGKQWAADRYSYLPGLALSLLWGGGHLWIYSRLSRRGLRGASVLCVFVAVMQLVLLSAVTVRQITYWRDTGTLATRIIDLMPLQSLEPYYARGEFRLRRGENEAALQDVEQALMIAQRKGETAAYPQLGSAKAYVLYKLGRHREALFAADWAIGSDAGLLPADFLAFRDGLARRLSEEKYHK